MIYLDNAATTRIDGAVLGVIREVSEDCYANPSSLYREGFRAHGILERARRTVADSLGCSADEIIFTATGTEANNLAVLGGARAKKQSADEVIISGYEHASVHNTAVSLKLEGFKVRTVNPGADGKINEDDVLRLVNKNTALVSVMRVNNETGAVTDTPRLAEEVKKINRRTSFHCDMIQSFMKYPIKLSGSAIDTASFSAHKIHGPKGVGALYVRKGFNLKPVIFGGGQERGFRSGTENLIFAAAMAKAAEVFDSEESFSKVSALNHRLRKEVAGLKSAVINSPEDASVYILNVSLPGFRSETLLHYLDENGVMASGGSACSKGAASHTLRAMGISDGRIDSSLRISFSKYNTVSDVERVTELLTRAKDELVSVNR